MIRRRALAESILAAGCLLLSGAGGALGHAFSSHVDFPFWTVDPADVEIPPRGTLSFTVNATERTTMIYWWLIVLCHCESHRLRYTLLMESGMVMADEVLAFPTYQRQGGIQMHADQGLAYTFRVTN